MSEPVNNWKSVEEPPAEDGLYIVEWEDGTIGETSYFGFYGWDDYKKKVNVKRWKERKDAEERVTIFPESPYPYITGAMNDEIERLRQEELEEEENGI